MENSAPVTHGKISLEIIDSLEKFEAIKSSWEKVYKSDPNGQLFLSWHWYYSWLKSMSYRWLIISLIDSKTSEYVAFLPLINGGLKVLSFRPIRRLTMGGQPYAIYTGILCMPEYEPIALPEMASYIQNKLKWDVFNMLWVRDLRLQTFLSYFEELKFKTRVSNGLGSLFLRMPDNYDDYLLSHLGKNFRKNLRSRLRFIANNDEYRITMADKQTVSRDIGIMISLWKKRWGEKKEAVWHQKMLEHYFQNDLLWLYVVWHRNTPVGALSCLLDPAKNTVNAYITSYDPAYSKISPGIVNFGHAIKDSIEKGYTIFDFSVGLDRYKLLFGPKKQKTKNVVIQRVGFRSSFPVTSIKIIKSISNSITKLIGH